MIYFSFFFQICITGPSLPYNSLFHSAIAESPDGKGVILFGGQNYKLFFNQRIDKNRILELRARTNSWNTLNVTLRNARREHVVIPLT